MTFFHITSDSVLTFIPPFCSQSLAFESPTQDSFGWQHLAHVLFCPLYKILVLLLLPSNKGIRRNIFLNFHPDLTFICSGLLLHYFHSVLLNVLWVDGAWKFKKNLSIRWSKKFDNIFWLDSYPLEHEFGELFFGQVFVSLLSRSRIVSRTFSLTLFLARLQSSFEALAAYCIGSTAVSIHGKRKPSNDLSL